MISSSADATRTQVELGLGEVLEKVAEPPVAIPGLTEVGFGVEVDVAEDVFQFGLIGILDGFQDYVDQLADVGARAPLVEAVEAGIEGFLNVALLILQLDRGHDEALPTEGAFHAHFVSSVALEVLLSLVNP